MSNSKLERKLYLAKESPEPIFDLCDCDLKRVPSGIFALIKVLRKEILYLQENKLTTLKEGGNLYDLSMLKLLDLSSNNIEVLSPDIKYLKNLQVLLIDNNKLTSLPVEIGSLTNLEKLSLATNMLKILPDSLCKLSKLQYLDVRYNSNLYSLPTTLHRNKCLKFLLLNEDYNWISPPKIVVQNGINAILMYFAQGNGIDYDDTKWDESTKIPNTCEALNHLSLYDRFIEEEKLLQKLIMEKNILYQKEKEALLYQKSQNEKKKLLKNLIVDQQKLDEEISRFFTQKEQEQNKFIQQLQFVESTADAVIKQLIETNNSSKQQSFTDTVSHLTKGISLQQNQNVSKKVLESMEMLLLDEYNLTKILKENDIIRKNFINVSSVREIQIKEKISELLVKRKNEQNILINSIKEDTELQYAALLMLIEKIDSRNVEFKNQIAVIQTQLSNLTVLEIHNKNLRKDKNIIDLTERRSVLSKLLEDIFTQQQSRRMQLIEQLKQIENHHSFENKNEYWLIQYQHLLDNWDEIFASRYTINSSLAFELALFGVSHYIPFLCIFDLNSVNGLSQITNVALKSIGINSSKDRHAVLKAVQHFIDQQHNNGIPAPPSNLTHDIVSPAPLSQYILEPRFIDQQYTDIPSAPPADLSHDIVPTAPLSQYNSELECTSLLNEVLHNECVICLEKQSNVVFLTCGHLCSCTDCSLLIKTCPMCRSDIEKKMPVFIV
ncbi:hypothetical protein PGB90_006479 [Kerria lacca]